MHQSPVRILNHRDNKITKETIIIEVEENQNQKQRRQYCFFHRENKGHLTRDCPNPKETQERIKGRENPQPPQPQPPREVNHAFATPPQQQQYCPIYPSLNSTQIHPSTLAAAYYPSFMPAWWPTLSSKGGQATSARRLTTPTLTQGLYTSHSLRQASLCKFITTSLKHSHHLHHQHN
jgi:hypothetical protein